MIEVLLVDDHPLLREGLIRIISDSHDIEVAGEASTAVEAHRQIERRGWDVVVLDLTLPDRSGLDVLAEIRRRGLATPVLVLSMHPEEAYAVRLLRAGADGYLTKEAAPEQLIAAIRRVARGGKYVTAAVAEILATTVQGSHREAPHEALTDRELEVFQQLAAGRTVGEIAGRLCLSVKTVSTHRAHILEKMGLKNNAQLMRYAVDHGLEM